MCDSARSLKNCCIDYIAANISAICKNQTSVEGQVYQVLSTDDEFYLPDEIAEQLMDALSDKGKIEDWTLMLFDSKFTRLRNVRLRNASKLTLTGLRTLRPHRISNLEVTGLMNVSVNDLICCLGEETRQVLQTLNIANLMFVDNEGNFIAKSLPRLLNLRSVIVSNTEFNNQDLEMVVQYLLRLEKLDISGTRVFDITPLAKCKDSLTFLSVANVLCSSNCDDVDIICELHHLRYLDMSDDGLYILDENALRTFLQFRRQVDKLLKRSCCLPFLSFLDISGIGDVLIEDLRNFLDQHPNLSFLGLIRSNTCTDEIFTNSKHDLYNPNLAVAGTANETQILEALRRYPKHAFRFHEALGAVLRLVHGYVEPRIDIISLILPGMKAHPENLDFQACAVACLCNLTKGKFDKKIHLHYFLKEIVELVFTAMENFPNNLELQKNAITTLCSDWILHHYNFDKYRYVRVAMDSLCADDDVAVERMTIGICCTLVTKMSPAEKTRIGTQSRYMKKLLSIVENKLEETDVDVVMKFTLLALWNFTDDSPETCRVFLNEGGLDLYLKVLDKFQTQSEIERHVLRLMYNVAEITKLRPALMTENFLTALRSRLKSSIIDIIYFAAGITAHLASDGERAWSVTTVQRTEMLQELEAAVTSWKSDVVEIATYQSFIGFFPLLMCFETKEVQVWAVWAVHHVCSINTKEYCPMLIKEGGVKIIGDLLSNQQTSKSVKEICRQILDLVGDGGMSLNVDESSR